MIQLIYVSHETKPFSKPTLSALLKKSREHNQAAGLSGMLVYHSGFFLQVLEGEEPEVTALYQKISSDPRHGDVRLLLRTEIEEPQFADWSMGFVDSQGEYLDVPGFVDFFGAHGVDATGVDQAGKAWGVLQGFRRGQWRNRVETGPAPAARTRGACTAGMRA